MRTALWPGSKADHAADPAFGVITNIGQRCASQADLHYTLGKLMIRQLRDGALTEASISP